MIHLLDFEIIEDPDFVDSKWVVNARFIDTDSPTSYDKMFSIAGGKIKDILRKAEYECSVVCSAPDPRDIETLNELFKDYRP